MKAFSLLLLSTLLFHHTTHGQSLEKKVDRPIEFYFDMGWVIGPSDLGAQLDYLISVDYTPGIRWSTSISEKLDLLGELSYHNVHYHLHQEAAKLIPNTVVHDRERFYIHVMNIAPVLRYQLGSKGWYADFGINLDWNFRRSHMTKNPDSNGDAVKVFDRSIDYFEPFNTDLLARIGKGRWTLHCTYRFTKLIKEASGLPGLPPTVVGIGLSL